MRRQERIHGQELQLPEMVEVYPSEEQPFVVMCPQEYTSNTNTGP